MFFVTVLLAVVLRNVYAKIACTNAVYCNGPLLQTIQLAEIFNDSKTFVDMKMTNSYETTLLNFDNFMLENGKDPTREQIRKFIVDNFEEGDELERIPSDYNPNPKFLYQISNKTVKELAENLVKLWPKLSRKVKLKVVKEPSQYSLIPVPNGFIVPGGRFKEFYYWDSYWIIKGLLISEMDETAKGMIDNFLHVVKQYGFLPNGGRIYYINRSQPPLLAKMVLEYYKYSSNKDWLQKSIRYLDKELQFWLNKRTVQVKKNGKTYTLARYNAESSTPRSESYLEDTKIAEAYDNLKRQEELYKNLCSATESGWDFSSRWIFDEAGGNAANLSYIQTTRIIPVDLNSFLCEAFHIISYLYSEIGNSVRSKFWKRIANHWKRAVNNVLWNDEDGTWYDFDIVLRQPRRFFYPSNISPLWCGCFREKDSNRLGDLSVRYLIDSGATSATGGIPTSLVQSGLQWDLPNAWSPLQIIILQGLERTGSLKALDLAKFLTKKWINANLIGFSNNKQMYEKYNTNRAGQYGEGGEYSVQSGFGWTNGVALELIYKYFT